MITGAARGFGDELVRTFIKNNYRVFATARSIPTDSKAGAVWYKLDVSNYTQCEEAMEVAFKQLGRVDILINNASGYFGGVSIPKVKQTDIDKELETTLRGPIYLSKLYAEYALLQGAGKIIFISSTAGLYNEPKCELYSVYAAAKAGLIRFAECLNEDIQNYGMQAHVLIPGSMKPELASVPQDTISYKMVADTVFRIATSKSQKVSHILRCDK